MNKAKEKMVAMIKSATEWEKTIQEHEGIGINLEKVTGLNEVYYCNDKLITKEVYKLLLKTPHLKSITREYRFSPTGIWYVFAYTTTGLKYIVSYADKIIESKKMEVVYMEDF